LTDIQYIKGDATAPLARGAKIVAHVCNDAGKWGKGFVLAVTARWPEAERAYRQRYRKRAENDYGLGAVQFVPVGRWLWVANMVGQHGVGRGTRTKPIRYEAVARCLETVAGKAAELRASVHMPRIGCGLAGGKWERIEPLIVRALSEHKIPVTVCDL
jgi:O-acetyl-ADP-ribose deacetylase (regulator of RNase III)